MATMVEDAEARGEARGKAETLLQLVRWRFSDVTTEREAQVRSATLEQLEAWWDRVFDAPDVDSLFGGSGRAQQQPQG